MSRPTIPKARVLLYVMILSVLGSSMVWLFYQSNLQFQVPLIKITASYDMIADLLESISAKVKVSERNCENFIYYSGNDSLKVNKSLINIGNPISDESYLNLTSDCESFQRSRGYVMTHLTQEEKDFPLAYSLMVYKEAEMVERLFRAIYRPQNVYCFHVDGKSSDTFYLAVSAIAQCFPNAFLASRRLNVKWGTFTVLEPELLCMKELWRYPKWKYFINLTGQEFPLKTNFELVNILKAYNGAVDVTTTFKHAKKKRWKSKKPPNNLKPVKGSVHIVVNREYVDYVLHNKTAETLLNWTKQTMIPDETFFAMLNANPQLGIRGTYKGEPEPSPTRPFMARYKIWRPFMTRYNIWKRSKERCAGRYVRQICILTTGDLPMLRKAPQLFANKFFLSEDRLVIGCLEEKLANDTRDEYLGKKIFNTSYYSNLDFVTNQVV